MTKRHHFPNAHLSRILACFQKERKKRGWSYGKLAIISGVNVATVHATLTGKSSPSFIVVESIANAFGYHQILS